YNMKERLFMTLERTVTHEKNFLMTFHQVEENQRQVSTRRLALDNNISRSLVIKVFNKGGYFSYQKKFIHKIKSIDPRVRPSLILSTEFYFYFTDLKTDNKNLEYIVLQQDRALRHTSFITIFSLKFVFYPSNIILHNSDFGWSERSSYLNSSNFILGIAQKLTF
uniref:Uncharacterized protein n=1 Tax=Strongyloides stercoralis TaxID=6248 RepID=A0AAF5DLF0_STRER